MKSVLLVGCGAEIGSTLVGLLRPESDGLEIGGILTNPIAGDPKHPMLGPLNSLLARVVLANPDMLDHVSVDDASSSLVIRGRSIPVWWGDARNFDLESLGRRFDACILATSKTHIGDNRVIGRFRQTSEFVLGVSEARQLPALYPNLIGAPTKFLVNKPQPMGSSRIFALGSCQSNGWQAMLRAVLDVAEHCDLRRLDFRSFEIDIVHPDTPTGRLGTQSFEARSQDPRDNLRPSFSQVPMAMRLIFPGVPCTNTVSLRTLVQPPGYQICRFFFAYSTRDGRRLSRADLEESLRKTAKALPHMLRLADVPLGSRAYANCESTAILLMSDRLLHWFDDPFRLGVEAISELLTQSYVHNVRGYCRSVINAIKSLFDEPNLPVFLQTE